MISAPNSTSQNTPSALPLPELFGRAMQLLGWQGITAHVPADWNLAAFGGDISKGNFRLVDDEGLRLEIFWDKPKGTPNVERSIELLLERIEKDAKKKQQAFERIQNPKLIPRSRKEHTAKEQLINFGWKGDARNEIAHGWGASWHCASSKRVIVAHIVGRGTENPDKTRRLAAEILSTLDSQSKGGWQTWSAFGLQLDMPEEFELKSAKLQTGRLEFDWERVAPHVPMKFLSPREWLKRKERIGLRRISAANIVLEIDSLEEWTRRVAAIMFKKFRFWNFEETRIGGEEALVSRGALKDLRIHAAGWTLDRVLRRPSLPPELVVWHNAADNKIFVLFCDLWSVNAKIKNDIIDSLESRQ